LINLGLHVRGFRTISAYSIFSATNKELKLFISLQ
jgi:hypothetical protein